MDLFAADDRSQSQSKTDLFISFTWLALQGFGGVLAVATGLIAGTGLKLCGAVKTNPMGIPVCVALGLICFGCGALLKWPLIYVLPGLGAVAFVMTFRKLKS